MTEGAFYDPDLPQRFQVGHSVGVASLVAELLLAAAGVGELEVGGGHLLHVVRHGSRRDSPLIDARPPRAGRRWA